MQIAHARAGAGVERDTAWMGESALAFDERGRAVVAARVVVA